MPVSVLLVNATGGEIVFLCPSTLIIYYFGQLSLLGLAMR